MTRSLIERGEIWLATVDPAAADGQGGSRPHLVVSTADLNAWPIIVVMLVPQALFLSLPTAATNIIRVVVVILLAALVTLTTRTEDLIDAIEHALGPLRRLGVNPSRIALMLSMTIATVPVIAGFAVQVREAQRARGVPVRPLTFVVPLLVMALKHSDELADALTARGID